MAAIFLLSLQGVFIPHDLLAEEPVALIARYVTIRDARFCCFGPAKSKGQTILLKPRIGLTPWATQDNCICEFPTPLGAAIPVQVMINGAVQQGWVAEKDLIDIQQMRSDVLRWLPTNRSEAAIALPMPRLIQIQTEKTVQLAWSEVEQAVQANLGLPENERSPTPWLRRGQLWSLVGSHGDALRDFVTAASLMRGSSNDLSSYAEYFVTLEKELVRDDRRPVRPIIAGGLKYWADGVYAYRNKEYDKALRNCYDAVQLSPSRPVFWYSRAMTFKSLGLDQEAERDARLGVQIEIQQRKANNVEWVNEIPWKLEYLSNPHRAWIQGFRNGDHDLWRPLQ